LLCDTWQLL
nr:immunoglobulin heavy chain junction region [Homo sapiens]